MEEFSSTVIQIKSLPYCSPIKAKSKLLFYGFRQLRNVARYCIVFKVAKAMKACRRSKETSALRRGETLKWNSNSLIWLLTFWFYLTPGKANIFSRYENLKRIFLSFDVWDQVRRYVCPASPKRVDHTWETAALVMELTTSWPGQSFSWYCHFGFLGSSS